MAKETPQIPPRRQLQDWLGVPQDPVLATETLAFLEWLRVTAFELWALLSKKPFAKAGLDDLLFLLFVNALQVRDPNFNDTTPAAPTGFSPVIWQSSGSKVSGHVALDRSVGLKGGVLGSWINAAVDSSAAKFSRPFQGTAVVTSSQEAVIADSGYVKNLMVTLSATLAQGNAVSIIMFKNGFATSLSVTIPPGSAAGVYSNTTTVIRIEESDQITWRLSNAGAGTSAIISSISLEWLSDNDFSLAGQASDNTTHASNEDFFYSMFDDLRSSAEGVVQIPWPIGGTFSRLYFKTNTTQHSGGTFDVTLRVGGVSSALTLSIAASTVLGIFSDPTNSVVVNAGDLICLLGENAAGGVSAKWVNTNMRFFGDGSSAVVGGSIGAAIGGSNTIHGSPFGSFEASVPTEADWAVPRDGVFRNLYVSMRAAHPSGQPLTITLQVDGVDTTIVITIGGEEPAGVKSNTTDSATVTKGQRVRIKFANANGNPTANLGGWAVEFSQP